MRLGRTMPRAPHMQLADKELVTNSANPSHPYDREGKPAAIEATAIQNASSGYAHVAGVRRKAAVVRKVQKRMAAELQQQRK
jgi:hypothetical protein